MLVTNLDGWCRAVTPAKRGVSKRCHKKLDVVCVLDINLNSKLKEKLHSVLEDSKVYSRSLKEFPASLPATEHGNDVCEEDVLRDYGLTMSQFAESLPDFLLSNLAVDEEFDLRERNEQQRFEHVKGNQLSARARRVVARRQQKSDADTHVIVQPSVSESSSSSNEAVNGFSNSISKDHFLACIKNNVGSTLLTKEEEIFLSRKLRASTLLESKRKILQRKIGKPLQDADLSQYLEIPVSRVVKILLQGNQAREKLISSNLRLVISVAKQFLGRGLLLEDLVQYGMIGLIRGIEKFDPTRGYRLSTYVHWWIKQSINRSVANHSRTVRIPIHVQEKLGKIYRARTDLESKLTYSSDEVTMKDLAAAVGMSEQKVRRLLKARVKTISMDASVRGYRCKAFEKPASLHHFVADPNVENPWDSIQSEFTMGEIIRILGKLSKREQAILKAHYGLEGKDGPISLEEVSRSHGISRERARQIEIVALQRLRTICEEESFEQIVR